jgi:hypothetical protein
VDHRGEALGRAGEGFARPDEGDAVAGDPQRPIGDGAIGD